MTAQELKAQYLKRYPVLWPDRDSIALVSEMWGVWESKGQSRPDIGTIARSTYERENAFFQELVAFCRRFEPPPNGTLAYCSLGLYDYNFRKVTATDGCVVLADVAFERLLFFLATGLMFMANETLDATAISQLQQWLQDQTVRWYALNEEFYVTRNAQWEAAARSYDDLLMGVYLAQGMHAFALAHEIGHHARGHNASPTRLMVPARHRAYSIIVDQQSHDEEFQADSYAYDIYTRLHEVKDGENPLCFVWWFKFAPLLLFDICDVLEQVAHRARIKGDGGHSQEEPAVASRSHPTPIARRGALVAQPGSMADDELYSVLRAGLHATFGVRGLSQPTVDPSE